MLAKTECRNTRLTSRMGIWKTLVLLTVYFPALFAYCEQKPSMPVQDYIFYRRAKEFDSADGSASIHLQQYRLPTEQEKRAYLYSNYAHDFVGGGNGDTITFLDIRPICSWLIKDAPKENIPHVVEFISQKNKEFEKVQAEYINNLNERKGIVRQALCSLADLGADAMPYYMEFLKSDSEIIYGGAIAGVSELFESKNISEQQKRKWIEDLVELVWVPNTPCRKRLVQELLRLDGKGLAPMKIEDWVSICFGEKDISVFEQVYSLYPKEFREWEKKEGGFRPLVWE